MVRRRHFSVFVYVYVIGTIHYLVRFYVSLRHLNRKNHNTMEYNWSLDNIVAFSLLLEKKPISYLPAVANACFTPS
jgi:hypothetical protein